MLWVSFPTIILYRVCRGFDSILCAIHCHIPILLNILEMFYAVILGLIEQRPETSGVAEELRF
jgi:hypothetical protein